MRKIDIYLECMHLFEDLALNQIDITIETEMSRSLCKHKINSEVQICSGLRNFPDGPDYSE